jgi:hypothetical protein
MRPNLCVPAALAALLLSPGLATATDRSFATFQSGTLLGSNGQPYRPAVGQAPYLPFGGGVTRLPSGRTLFVPQSTVSYSFAPGAAPPWPTSNLAVAAPQIIRIGRPEPASRGERVTVINGSSAALRPETGPKIIRIER